MADLPTFMDELNMSNSIIRWLSNSLYGKIRTKVQMQVKCGNPFYKFFPFKQTPCSIYIKNNENIFDIIDRDYDNNVQRVGNINLPILETMRKLPISNMPYFYNRKMLDLQNQQHIDLSAVRQD